MPSAIRRGCFFTRSFTEWFHEQSFPFSFQPGDAETMMRPANGFLCHRVVKAGPANQVNGSGECFPQIRRRGRGIDLSAGRFSELVQVHVCGEFRALWLRGTCQSHQWSNGDARELYVLVRAHKDVFFLWQRRDWWSWAPSVVSE